MKQSEFIKKNESLWKRLEKGLLIIEPSQDDSHVANKRRNISIRNEKIEMGDTFPENYRLICHHLSLARSRCYSPLLVERLEKLVIHAHQQYYQRKTHLLSSILNYFTSGFAHAVRKEWVFVLLSAVLFFGSFFGMLITLQYYPDMVYTVISGEQLANMESMYDPANERFGRDQGGDERSSSTDFQMFGFYIFNNTGIGLRTFASGLVVGIGVVFTLIFNGLMIGAVAGYLTYIGYGSTFWPFVSGHSAMELMAIVLSGAAGFKLGFAIISPGRKSRLRSLRDNAKEAVFMMYGIVSMFIMAAFIEAYWSSMADIPAFIKYSVGAFFWLGLLLYFVFVGRSHAAR